MPIPWYYTWSDRFFHEVLQHSMKDSAFTLIPLERKGHVYSQIVELLECSQESYIVYSDSELIINSDIFKNINPHINSSQTMVFLEEEQQPSISFMLLKVCPEVINFFKTLNKATPIYLAIKDYKEKWTLFDNQLFTSSSLWNMKNNFSLMKPLTSNLGKEYDFAEKIFTMGQHINLDAFMHLVPEEIIQCIYKFQELLYRSHQESRTAVIL
jgi:hypothetical protein